ncbi:MAG: Gfo/Idh/MocA family oxidoreductase [Chloroflexi bacterium]|nr:Gfo/Idh/MocA family oxidoreductase [Chloroflexota bacterium]
MIRLGVVGYGRRIHGVIDKVLRTINPDVRVVGIVDPNEAGARSRLAACDQADVIFYGSLGEMVRQARLDGLAIGTRCNLHTPYAIEAAQYDVPLFLEKPVATSMAQAMALEEAYTPARCPVVVSFPLRVSPLCRLARQYIAEGAVGAPMHVAANNYVPYGTIYFEDEYRNYEITQGLFLQKATHDLDYLSFLMGEPIVRVAATWTRGRVFGGKKRAGLVCSQCEEQEVCLESPQNRRRNQTTGSKEDHFCDFSVDIGSPETGMNEDCSSALLQFASGAHGVYTQVFYARRDAAARGATVSGYLGQVSFDWTKNELHRVRHHAPFSAVERAGDKMSHFGGDQELGLDYLGIIKGTATSRTPIEAGIQSVYACLAAKQSAEEGRFVEVRQVGQYASLAEPRA